MVRIALNVSCVWKADTSAMTTSGLARLERLNKLKTWSSGSWECLNWPRGYLIEEGSARPQLTSSRHPHCNLLTPGQRVQSSRTLQWLRAKDVLYAARSNGTKNLRAVS